MNTSRDAVIRSLPEAQRVMLLSALMTWTAFALASLKDDTSAGYVLVWRLLLALAIIFTVGTFGSGYVGQLLTYLQDKELEGAIKRRGGEANCHTLAEQYVREYQNARMHPFTREEEGELINYLMARFGVFEETAAEIVAANWPLHRSPLPYREAVE
ncbi:MAG TPA: hypothetical protein VGB98_26340 [Pyrinomonadaceae bacterium]